MSFWDSLDKLISDNEIVIDRKKGSAHPRYPDYIYPLDYGFIKNTRGGDGDGIDVWVGSDVDKKVTACVAVFDGLKNEMELKLLIACTKEEQLIIVNFHARGQMTAELISR